MTDLRTVPHQHVYLHREQSEQAQSSTSTSASSSNLSNTLNTLLWIPLHNLIDQLLTQLSRVVSSDKTQRSAIGAVVFGTLLAILLLLASGTYALFYWLYIPRVTHVLPMYLQYGATFGGQHLNPAFSSGVSEELWNSKKDGGLSGWNNRNVWYPHAVVDFTQDVDPKSGLKPEQYYNLGVQLLVADSPANLELGNFMVSMDLISAQNKTLASSNRPAILKYKSDMFRSLSTMYYALSMLWGFRDESQNIRVLLVENYMELQSSPVQKAIIKITAPNLQVYEAFVTVEAHFQGLRYFMYHWQFTTGAVFITVFMFYYAIFGLIMWRMFLAWFRNMNPKNKVKKSAGAGSQNGGKSPSSTKAETEKSSKGEQQASSFYTKADFPAYAAPNTSDFEDNDAVPDSSDDSSDEEAEYIGGVPTTFAEGPASVPLSGTISGRGGSGAEPAVMGGVVPPPSSNAHPGPSATVETGGKAGEGVVPTSGS
ncbi:Berardinelli-Seip congenital lipodystrophy 2 (seipin) [Chytridiales sp. JEL 0842]|nr:Berardinelli-Seip congenital lipodystrophy 2 (seipin) [Chytridiales sp. JEL 0842]